MIPRTIHQLWKTADPPARYTALRETWRWRNPRWTLRLWTDAELLALVEARRPDLLEMFHAYPRPICRADLGRYFVLETFGGVYADLDCECLRPLDGLLEGLDFAIGLEPDEHQAEERVRESGLARILCPSFIASIPGHPFWAHVRQSAAAAFGKGDVLDQTGPFLLTRAFETYEARGQITLLPAAQLYPFHKNQCWDESVCDLEVWERGSREAFVAHYWEGGWFRGGRPLDGLPSALSAKLNAVPAAPTAYPDDPEATRISCVTAAEGWTEGLRLAVESYLRQTHSNKELLIVTPTAGRALEARLREWGRSDIRLVGAAAAASGAVLCGWEAGALHDPQRLETQFRVLRQAGAQACALSRQVEWRPAARRMAIGAAGILPGSLMVLKAHWALDQALRGRMALIDLPRLILKVSDADDGFEARWAGAAARFEGKRCDAVTEHLAMRLPIALARPEPASPRTRTAAPGEIVILTPVKDARRWLPRYFELVSRLDGGKAALAIAFLEGDSRDGTWEALQATLPSLEGRFSRIETWRRHDGLEILGPRWAPPAQLARRAAIARARNRLLSAALGEAEWALWLDADVMDYPADLLLQLLAAGKDIIVPHCVGPDGHTFDLNTFLFAPDAGGQDDPQHLLDGLYQPPRGHRRLYLEDVADQDLVRVDSVGGTALLVRADLHRAGLNFPTYSHGGYIETEGLAMMARDMGHACWALPKLRITHPFHGEGA